MKANPERVVVKEGFCSQCLMPSKQVHHCHFPEIRAACNSIVEGHTHLIELLNRYRDGAQSLWHRGTIDTALSDVKASLESLQPESTLDEMPCRCEPRVNDGATHASSTSA